MDKATIEQLEKELNVPVVPRIDLSMHIKIQQRNNRWKIGVLAKDINGLVGFKAGEFVLYEPYSVKDGIDRMLWKDLERHVKLCTISRPNKRFFEGKSNIDTHSCTIAVPLSYIEFEILITEDTK